MADDALTAGLARGRAAGTPVEAANDAADRVLANYLDDLRRELRHEPDVEDVMDEVADHLHAAIARHESGGASHGIAVSRALGSFGGAGPVGEGFRERPELGAGLPTSGSRLAGLAMRMAAFTFPAMLLLFLWADQAERSTGSWEGTAQDLYTVGAVFVLLGSGLGAWGAIGLLSRHGRLASPIGKAVVVLVVLGAVSSIIAWAIAFWTAVLGLAWLATMAVLGRRTVLSPVTTRLLQVGYPLAFVGTMAAAILTNGVSENFDWQLAGPAPGLLCMAVGLFLAGRTLADEEILDHPTGTAA